MAGVLTNFECMLAGVTPKTESHDVIPAVGGDGDLVSARDGLRRGQGVGGELLCAAAVWHGLHGVAVRVEDCPAQHGAARRLGEFYRAVAAVVQAELQLQHGTVAGHPADSRRHFASYIFIGVELGQNCVECDAYYNGE